MLLQRCKRVALKNVDCIATCYTGSYLLKEKLICLPNLD